MNSRLFEKFIKDRHIRKSTCKGYESALKHYENFHGISVDELIDEAFAEENRGVILKNRKIKERLIDFRTFLLESDFSPNTSKTYFSKVKTFYMHFEVEMPVLSRAKYEKIYQVNYLDLPSHEHIREAVVMSSIDVASVILFMSSSGTAKAETLSLKVSDFVEATSQYHSGGGLNDVLAELSHKKVIPMFYLKRLKTDKYYYTFCSPEACEYIVRYLKTRKALKLDDKLFDFTSSQLLYKFQEINDKLEWGFKGKYRFFRSHTLRKFHASNIGLSSDYIDELQGRGKSAVHEAYIKRNPLKLKEIYESVVENVEVLSKTKTVQKQEFTIVINVFLSGKEYNII